MSGSATPRHRTSAASTPGSSPSSRAYPKVLPTHSRGGREHYWGISTSLHSFGGKDNPLTTRHWRGTLRRAAVLAAGVAAVLGTGATQALAAHPGSGGYPGRRLVRAAQASSSWMIRLSGLPLAA